MLQLIIRYVCFSNNLSLAVLDKFYDIKIFSLYSGRVKMLHNFRGICFVAWDVQFPFGIERSPVSNKQKKEPSLP